MLLTKRGKAWILVALVTLSVACALAVGTMRPMGTLVVVNESWYDLRVYTLQGSMKGRLGMIVAQDIETFSLRQSNLNVGLLYIRLEPVGMRNSAFDAGHTMEGFSMPEDGTARLMIRYPFESSYFQLDLQEDQ